MAWTASAPTAHGQCGALFAAPASYEGAGQGIATADLNGDGRLDLVVTTGTGYAKVLLGNGNGTFQSPRFAYTDAGNVGVTIADLNGDGRPDLAVAIEGSNDLSVLLGNGDGTFQSAVNYPTGTGCRYVAIGDMNGDGRPDLVAANKSGNSISVLLGNGNGSFQPATNYALPGSPNADHVVLGDLNGDGRLDVVVANASVVTVLLGNGNGTLQSPSTLPAFAQGVALGDLNGDGRLDIVTGNGGVYVLLGIGNGTFQTAVSYPTGSNLVARNVVIGDFNGDGRPDVLTANDYTAGSPGLSLLLGNGNGTLQPAVNYSQPLNPQFAAIGDFNGDGRPDFAVSSYTSGYLGVYLNASPMIGISQQPASQAITTGQNASFSVTAAGASSYQWRRNGAPLANGSPYAGVSTSTLAITNATSAQAGIYDVRIVGGCNSGQLSQPASLTVTTPVCRGDFNSDGRFDGQDVQAIVNALIAGQTCP